MTADEEWIKQALAHIGCKRWQNKPAKDQAAARKNGKKCRANKLQ
jgi:hypothetical protein